MIAQISPQRLDPRRRADSPDAPGDDVHARSSARAAELYGGTGALGLAEYGNTVSSTIPILIHDLRAAGRLLPGMRCLLIGFGVGLSWAGCAWTKPGAVRDTAERRKDEGERMKDEG